MEYILVGKYINKLNLPRKSPLVVALFFPIIVVLLPYYFPAIAKAQPIHCSSISTDTFSKVGQTGISGDRINSGDNSCAWSSISGVVAITIIKLAPDQNPDRYVFPAPNGAKGIGCQRTGHTVDNQVIIVTAYNCSQTQKIIDYLIVIGNL